MLKNFFIPAIVLIATINPAYADEHSSEIAKLKSGKITSAKASWWNPDKNNATKALQEAINSGAKQIIIDNIGHDWIIEPIFLRDNQEIVFEKGVRVTALKGAFKELTDSMFTAAGKKNIKIRGEGDVVIRMHKSDYLDPEKYKQGEWRHMLRLTSCENIEISNLTLSTSGGDGIYIGVGGKPMKYCKNITIENVICDGHSRQGCSVISAENLFIRKCIFKNTKGALPMDGIDFEPNNASERLVNCVVEDCEFINNANSGIELYLVCLDKTSVPVSFTFRNCKTDGNPSGIKICISKDSKKQPVCGFAEFDNCLAGRAESCPLLIRNLPVDSVKLVFKNCTFDAAQSKNAGKSPITLKSSSEFNADCGGICFVNTTVIDNIDRNVLAHKNWASGKIQNISGNITLEKNGTKQEIDPAELIKNFKSQPNKENIPAKLNVERLKPMPQSMKSSISFMSKGFIFRGKTVILKWAEKGQTTAIPLILRPVKLGLVPVKKASVKINAPSGRLIKEFEQPFDAKEHSYEFIAGETGVYTLTADADSHQLVFSDHSCNWNISAENKMHLMYPEGRMYFQVPAGVKNFSMEISCAFGETVAAAILNQDRQVVQKKAGIETPYIFEVSRKDASNSEIWAIEFTEAVEDVFVQFHAPLNPVLSSERNELLITE